MSHLTSTSPSSPHCGSIVAIGEESVPYCLADCMEVVEMAPKESWFLMVVIESGVEMPGHFCNVMPPFSGSLADWCGLPISVIIIYCFTLDTPFFGGWEILFFCKVYIQSSLTDRAVILSGYFPCLYCLYVLAIATKPLKWSFQLKLQLLKYNQCANYVCAVFSISYCNNWWNQQIIYIKDNRNKRNLARHSFSTWYIHLIIRSGI